MVRKRSATQNFLLLNTIPRHYFLSKRILHEIPPTTLLSHEKMTQMAVLSCSKGKAHPISVQNSKFHFKVKFFVITYKNQIYVDQSNNTTCDIRPITVKNTGKSNNHQITSTDPQSRQKRPKFCFMRFEKIDCLQEKQLIRWKIQQTVQKPTKFHQKIKEAVEQISPNNPQSISKLSRVNLLRLSALSQRKKFIICTDRTVTNNMKHLVLESNQALPNHEVFKSWNGKSFWKSEKTVIFCFQAAITLQNVKLSQPTQTNAPKSTKSRQNEVSKKFDVKFQKQATILLVHEDHGEVTKFFGSMFKFPLSNLSPKVKFPLANSFIRSFSWTCPNTIWID